jgi:hypothetical protein
LDPTARLQGFLLAPYAASLVLQNKDEINGHTTSDPSQINKNGSSLGFPFAVQPGDGNNSAAFGNASGGQELAKANQKSCVSYKETDTPTNVPSTIFSWPSSCLQSEIVYVFHWKL